MTYEVNIVIWCDADDCENRYEYQKRNEGGANKSRAAVMAVLRAGWHIPHYRPEHALCPTHKPKPA